jgi:hypothetical protein
LNRCFFEHESLDFLTALLTFSQERSDCRHGPRNVQCTHRPHQTESEQEHDPYWLPKGTR